LGDGDGFTWEAELMSHGTAQKIMRLRFHFILGLLLLTGIPTLLAATKVRMWITPGSGVAPAVTNVPPDLTNAVAIAAGSGHTLALTAEGRVVAWGDNTYGQISVPHGLSNIVAISAFSSNSLALTAMGDLVTWGTDYCQTNPLPTEITNVVGIAGGSSGGFALKEDGSYVAWSCNATGRFVTLLPPTLQAVEPSKVITVAYAERSQVSLDSSGHARTRFFQTGLTNLMTNVVATSVGYFHALGLTTDGHIVSVGDSSASFAPSGLSNAVAVAAGFASSMALLADGRLVSWNPQQPSPVPITIYEGTNVVAIGAGGSLQVALLDLGGDVPVGAILPGPRAVTNGIAISFPTERGSIYLLEHKSTITDAWAFNQLVAGNGGLREVVVPAAAQGFFRTRRVR
jgi:alpha-tubulin suppressor-like RCC1 family protein